MGEFGHDPGLEIRDEVAAPIFNSWLSHLFEQRDGSIGLLWQWVPGERLGPPNDDGFSSRWPGTRAARASSAGGPRPCDSAGGTLDPMRVELGADSWVEHLPGFLSPEEAARTHATLQAELTWEQREIVLFGRPVLQPRLIAWAGELPYRYSGQTLPPRPFTPTVAALLARVQARADVAVQPRARQPLPQRRRQHGPARRRRARAGPRPGGGDAVAGRHPPPAGGPPRQAPRPQPHPSRWPRRSVRDGSARPSATSATASPSNPRSPTNASA